MIQRPKLHLEGTCRVECFKLKVPGDMPDTMGGVFRITGERSRGDGRGVSDCEKNGAEEFVERDHGLIRTGGQGKCERQAKEQKA